MGISNISTNAKGDPFVKTANNSHEHSEQNKAQFLFLCKIALFLENAVYMKLCIRDFVFICKMDLGSRLK